MWATLSREKAKRNKPKISSLFFTLAKRKPQWLLSLVLILRDADDNCVRYFSSKNFVLSRQNQSFCILCKLFALLLWRNNQNENADVYRVSMFWLSFFFWNWKEFWHLSNVSFSLYKSYIKRAIVFKTYHKMTQRLFWSCQTEQSRCSDASEFENIFIRPLL